MHEVQKYVTLTNHRYLGYVVIANKKFWEGLPADIRANLEKAMAEATGYANDIAEKENAEALEAMQKSGKTEFHTPTEAERKAWMDALLPVHKKMASRIGQELLDRIYKTTGAAAK